jgi:hypothetical protein
MKKESLVLIVVMAVMVLPKPAQCDGSFKGKMFGDYYYVAGNNVQDLEGRHGLWFRRIYFTYNNQLTDNLKMRLRLEMDSPGDFMSKDKMVPVVKDAWLSYSFGDNSVLAGVISPPTFGKTIEDFWGYRCLEKTPLDLFKLRSSRDHGIAMKGNLNQSGSISYMAMFGNGSSNKGEINKGKIFYGALTFEPAEGFVLEAYGDYETEVDKVSSYVYQGFAGYQGDWGRIGLHFANKHVNAVDLGWDFSVLSGFAVISAGSGLDIIARYDKTRGDGWEAGFQGNKISYIPLADYVKTNLIIVGVSFKVLDSLLLIPNVKYAFYDEPEMGDKPDADIYANLSFLFKFK